MSTILKVEKNAEKAVKQVRQFCKVLVSYVKTEIRRLPVFGAGARR
jgi:hypothetical protein